MELAFHRLVHAAQHRRTGELRIVEVEQVAALLSERRKIFPAQAGVQRQARRNAIVIVDVQRRTIAAQICLSVAGEAQRRLRKSKQEVTERVPGIVRRSGIRGERSRVLILSARKLALQVIQLEVDPLHASLHGMPAARHARLIQIMRDGDGQVQPVVA